ncbi:MAG: hypothetical protein IT368_06020 [Candidatus Hydrogenedentes bacterium]|nr:hypothetical protein [Candidatus Hydrogenedentota bacterium]
MKNETWASKDESATGEAPTVLYPLPSLSGYIKLKEMMTAYSGLGCAQIIVGYSTVTGMAQLMAMAKVREAVPNYCRQYYESTRQLPTGIHEIETNQNGANVFLRFKFPEHVPVICVREHGNREFVPGKAALLARDWYLNGCRVHRLCPDDPEEIILRSPLRNEHDSQAAAVAIAEALALPRDLFHSSALACLARALPKVSEEFRKIRGYPVNIAEIYRLLGSPVGNEVGLDNATKQSVVKAIADYASQVSIRQHWTQEEAKRVRQLLHPNIFHYPLSASSRAGQDDDE